LLDLVLQLLMFFMICANFSAAANNEPVGLADSTTAKMPTDAESTQPTDVIYLTIKRYKLSDFESKLLQTGNQQALDAMKRDFNEDRQDVAVVAVGQAAPLKPADQTQVWLASRFNDIKRTAPGGDVKTAVVLRPGADVDYALVYRIMRFCRDAGFKNIKIRAIVSRVST
jgi:biopolymer transport protein ExbD